MAENFDVVNLGRIADRRLLLIDDIFDSGETMKETARILKEDGAAAVWPLALARTRRTRFSYKKTKREGPRGD